MIRTRKTKFCLAVAACSILIICAVASSVSAATPSLGNAVKKMTAYAAKDCYSSAKPTITLDSYSLTANTDNGWVGVFEGGFSNPIYVPTATGSSVNSYNSCAALVRDGMNKNITPYREGSMTASEFGKLMTSIGYEADASSGALDINISTTGGNITVACSNVGPNGAATANTTCGSPKGIITITYKKGQLTAKACADVGTNFLGAATCNTWKEETVSVGSSSLEQSVKNLMSEMGTGSNFCEVKKDGACIKYSGTVSSSGVASEAYQRGSSPNKYLSYIGAPSDLKLTKSEQEGLAWAYMNNFYGIQCYGNQPCSSCQKLTTDKEKQEATSQGYKPVYFGGNHCYVKPGKNANEVVPGWTSDGTPTGLQMRYDDLVKLFSDATSNNVIDGTQQCKDNAANRIAALQKELDYNKTMTDERRQEIKSQIAKIQEMQNNGTLWKQNSNGSITCNVPTASGDSSSTVYDPNDRNEALTDAEQNAENSGDGDTGTFDGCFSEAGVLGWILCPVLRIVSSGLGLMYNNVESNYLQTSPGLFNDLGDIWGKFRNFANTLFAVAFVVVILSQITGIGLSNYNIKKILPRLIAVVVLVNVSFFLCEVAVDLSNILGYGLRRFFDNLATGLEGGPVSENWAESLANTVTSIGGAGAGGLLLYASVQTGGWFPILITLLGVVIAAFVSILFLFVVLGVRRAAIIMLIVFSPIAIACYALPNTQGIFKKWAKLFADMLLVYPICGLLIGGSDFASRLLLQAGEGGDSNTGFMFYFVAMMLPVASFFFIPSILRSSINGIAGLGSKIQGWGRTAGMRGNMALRRSNWAMENMEESRRNAIQNFHARRVGRLANRLENGRFFGSKKRVQQKQAQLGRQLARSNAMVAKYRDEDIAAQVERFKNDANFDNQDIAFMQEEHAKALQEVFDNPDDYNAQVRLEAIENSMMKFKADDGAASIVDNYSRVLEKGLSANGSAGAKNVSDKIGKSANRFIDNHGASVKQAVGKSGAITMSDIASGKASSYGADGIVKYKDSGGNEHFYNKAAISGDVSKITGRDYEGFSDAKFDAIKAAIQNGHIDDPSDVQRIIGAANEFYSNPNINKKNSAMVDEITKSAITHGAVPHSQIGTGGIAARTVGSHALNGMSATTLNSIADKITSGGFSNAEVSQITSNLKAAAQDDSVTHTGSWVDAANNIMAAAHKKGIHQIDHVDNDGNVFLDSNTVADHVDAANVRFEQDRVKTSQVSVDPELTTATAADVHAAVEHAQAQFRESNQQYQNLTTATASDVQAALIQSNDPTMTVDKLGFKAGDIIRKVPAGGTSFNYSTVGQSLAEAYRNGLKNATKSVGISAGNVIRVTTDPSSGNKIYSKVSDAEAADYRAALEHNAYIKLHNGGSGSSGSGSNP